MHFNWVPINFLKKQEEENMKKRILLVIGSIAILSGCYTQFSTLEEKRDPSPEQVTYQIDSLGDTVKVLHTTDTVVRERENCYWVRNIWGQPEWRCGGSYYSRSWYLYNDYPWWYSSSPYYNSYNNRGGRGEYYHFRGNRESGGSEGGNAISPPDKTIAAHRSRTSTVRSQPTANSPILQNSTSSQSPSTSKVQAPVVENPTPVYRDAGRSAEASAPQPHAETVQSSPPASNPSPPANNDGGSENNERSHRNPRSR
jgi:hypothetical protein